MKYSLVTTCRNEMHSLACWRKNILEQTKQPDEIVIVDAFSDDGTAEELFSWAKNDLRVKIFQEKGAVAHGRNVAIEKASFEHIVSTDMGVRLVPEWFAELTAPFETDPDVELVLGNSCIDRDTLHTAVARAEFYIENGGFADPGPGVIGGNRSSAYLKKIWRECNGLPEDLTFCGDDSTFFRQMNEHGYKTAYAPGAMTLWGRPEKLKSFWKEAWNYGLGDGEAFIKEPWAFRQYRTKRLPWFMVLFINGTRVLQKKCTLAAFGRAFRKFDIPAILVMPVLAFGVGLKNIQGYRVGYNRGNTECLECRSRIKQGRHL